MRNESRSLLPGELKNCYFHCGSCKKRNLFQDFEKEKHNGFYKCPNCGKFIRRIYANKEEKLINNPIMEKNRNDFIHKWKTDSEFREWYCSYKIEK